MRNIDEQTILITGATSGLGREVAIQLARVGARVLLHGRDEQLLAKTRDAVAAHTGNERVETVLADLTELRHVAELGDAVRRRFNRLDVLVNNAAVGAGADQSMRERSADGIELRFAVNYLAGYRLTRDLLPLLTESAPARVVNVASAGQSPLDADDPLLAVHYSGTRAYAQSKLAQIMFTFDLAAELADTGVTVNALHPATYMNTKMVREAGVSPVDTVEQGVEATLRLITAAELDDVSGRYFHGTREARALDQAYDPNARARLRELSERLCADALV